MAQNPFDNVVEQLESAPQNQRPGKLIDGICQQMQQASGTTTPQQLGQQLGQVKSQITKLFPQQQGG